MNTVRNEFILSPVYCLHNGAVVLEQNNQSVTIGVLNPADKTLQLRLTHAVASQLEFTRPAANGDIETVCPSTRFIPLSKEEFSCRVSHLFSPQSAPSFKQIDVHAAAQKKQMTESEENAAAALLDSLLDSARSEGATDIHIEGSVVRFRVKGLLKHEVALDGKRVEQLVRRIKLLARLNMLEKRHGQDGQFVYMDDADSAVFVRVSCVPSVSSVKDDEGGSIVLRILDTKRVPLSLVSLGFSDAQVRAVEKFCLMKDGLVLICGPTGSGKSTTAAAMMEAIRTLKKDSCKIVSLEDPPEYILPGVTQIEIRSSGDMDFPEALRRTYRQDPDVIMIGEIRDELTAQTAVQAALTGHLVVATMHVSSADKAVLRLQNLGADKVLIRAVLHGVVVQHMDNECMTADVRSFEGVVDGQ